MYRRLIFVRILLFRFLHCWFLAIILLCYFYNTDSYSQLFSTSSADLWHFSCRATKKFIFWLTYPRFYSKLLDPHVWDAKECTPLIQEQGWGPSKVARIEGRSVVAEDHSGFLWSPATWGKWVWPIDGSAWHDTTQRACTWVGLPALCCVAGRGGDLWSLHIIDDCTSDPLCVNRLDRDNCVCASQEN